MRRTIIIGDVHGCYDELKEIIIKTEYNPHEDDLYFVGDLINRGPDSLSCFLYFKELGAKSVLGNHEQKHLYLSNNDDDALENIEKIKKEFKSYYSDFINTVRTWPYYYDMNDFFLVHAGIDPFKPLNTTDQKVLCTIRQITDPTTNRERPWFDFYHQQKLILFGHWSKLGGIIRKNIIGLDQSCVYGGKLRAIILPHRAIVEVSAKTTYYQPLSKKNK